MSWSSVDSVTFWQILRQQKPNNSERLRAADNVSFSKQRRENNPNKTNLIQHSQNLFWISSRAVQGLDSSPPVSSLEGNHTSAWLSRLNLSCLERRRKGQRRQIICVCSRLLHVEEARTDGQNTAENYCINSTYALQSRAGNTMTAASHKLNPADGVLNLELVMWKLPMDICLSRGVNQYRNNK